MEAPKGFEHVDSSNLLTTPFSPWISHVLWMDQQMMDIGKLEPLVLLLPLRGGLLWFRLVLNSLAKDDLELLIPLSLPPSASITGMSHHIRFIWGWDLDSKLPAGTL